MMGTEAPPERLFYVFCLEDHGPQDHLLRRIDRVLDLNDVQQKLRPFYRPIGMPSVDPELMIRMLIVGYCLAIRSERRLCEEARLNLAYRWFCRLGLDGNVPDHSTPASAGAGNSRATAMAGSGRATSYVPAPIKTGSGSQNDRSYQKRTPVAEPRQTESTKSALKPPLARRHPGSAMCHVRMTRPRREAVS